MKKIILLGAFIASTVSLSAQTAGKIFSGPSEGKAFQLGSEKSSQVVLDAVKAYNSNSSAAEMALWTEEMQKMGGDFNSKEINGYLIEIIILENESIYWVLLVH